MSNTFSLCDKLCKIVVFPAWVSCLGVRQYKQVPGCTHTGLVPGTHSHRVIGNGFQVKPQVFLKTGEVPPWLDTGPLDLGSYLYKSWSSVVEK